MVVEIAFDLSTGKSVRIHSYALEAWFATPFTIISLVEIYEISTKSRPNTSHFGEPI